MTYATKSFFSITTLGDRSILLAEEEDVLSTRSLDNSDLVGCGVVGRAATISQTLDHVLPKMG